MSCVPRAFFLLSGLLAVLGASLVWGQQPPRTPSSNATRPGTTVPRATTPAPAPFIPTGRALANRLQNTVSSLDRVKRYDEIEPAVERAVLLNANEWQVLFQGARIYAEMERSGYWLNGKYRRGDLHGNLPKGARRVYSHKRDHTRALQLLDRAIRLASTDLSMEGKAAFYWEAAQILVGDKAYLGMFELTDLSRLPTLEFQEPRVPNREPIQLDADGAPQFFRVPDSWDAARNDGERLLWLLDRARRLDSKYVAEAEFIYAKYLLKGYFGVQTITESSHYDPVKRTYDDGDRRSNDLIAALDTLPKTQSVAVVGGTLRQFELPEAFNFISKFEAMARGIEYREFAELAMEELAEIFENRRQYERASRYWKSLVNLSGGQRTIDSGSNGKGTPIPSWEADRLNQIVESWGRFEDVHPVQVGEPLSLAYWYRNGRQVKFSAYRVDVPELVADLLAYLRSDPFPIDPNRINVSKLGLNIVREGGDRYLKEKVQEWSLALEPSEKHWDKRVEVPVPLEKAGAYLVEAEIDGGHRCSVLVWINDMTILRRPLEDGLFYYVADKTNGKPVGWAKFTFVGYRLALVNQTEEPELDVHGEEIPEALRRQYHVLSKEIVKWADAKGQLTLDDSVLLPDYRWFLLTTAPDDRVAVLGFSDLKPVAREDHQVAHGVRHFLVSDKTAYLPGQTVHVKGWLREREEGQLTYQTPREATVNVMLVNARGEVMDQIPLNADGKGSFETAFELPKDLLPGPYALISRTDRNEGRLPIRIEPPSAAPVRLVLEHSEQQLKRGDAWRVTVRAEGTDGEWFEFAPVHYRVLRRPHQPRWNREKPFQWLYGEDYDLATPRYRWFPGWKYWGWDPTPVDEGEEIVVKEGETLTGADGTAAITVVTEEMTEALPVEEDYVLEVRSLEHPDMAPVTTQVVVSDRSYKVFAKVDQPYYQVGSEVTFDAWARRYDGSVVTGKGEVIVYHVQFDESGDVRESGPRVARDTDASGAVRHRFKVEKPGQYRVTYIVTDSQGDRFEGSAVFLCVDDRFDGTGCRFNSLEILSEKLIYQPGEKAKLRFNTSRTGQTAAVFVRPRDGVFGKAEVLRLDDKSTPYEVMVKETDQPSFFVEAIILNNGAFEVHAKEIFVSPPAPKVALRLTAPKTEYRPGEEALLTVSLADGSGQPTAGEVGFSLSLAPEVAAEHPRRPDVAQAFWDDRRRYEASVEHGLKTLFQSFSSPPEATMRPIGIFGSVRVGDTRPIEQVGLLENGAEMPQARWPYATRHAEMPAVWQPSVAVDASGEVTIPVTLPDIDGVWEARVWSVDPTAQVGEAVLPLSVRKRWAVAFQAPEYVVEGDQFTVVANVRNHANRAAEATILLQTPSTLSVLKGSREERLAVGPGEMREVRWEMLAQAPAEGAALQLMLGRGDEDREEREWTLKVAPRRAVSDRWWNVRLSGKEEEKRERLLSYSVPTEPLTEGSVLRVEASGGLLERMMPAFGDGVMERAMAQEVADDALNLAVPTLRFGQYLRGLSDDAKARLRAAGQGTWALEEGALERHAAALAQKVWMLQGKDGGWSRGGKESTALVTAGVLESLAELKALALVDLPEAQVKAATKRLQALQKEALKARKERNTLDAVVYHSLLRHGIDDAAMRAALMKDWKTLTVLGKTALAQALHLRGDHEDRNVIRFHLGEKLVKDEDSGAVHLPAENQEYWWKWYGNPVETQARYVRFLVQVKGDVPVTDAGALHLLQTARGPGQWTSNRASSQALGGLIDYVALKKAAPSPVIPGKLTLRQGDREWASASLEADADWNAYQLILKGDALAAAGTPAPEPVAISSDESTPPETTPNAEEVPEPMRLVYEGDGNVAAQVTLRMVTQPVLIEGVGSEMKVTRTYFRVTESEGESVREPLPAGATVMHGDVMEVDVTMSSDRALDELIWHDPWPAGVMLEGEAPEGWQVASGGWRAVIAALDEPQTFTYRLKATAEGLFHALPATLRDPSLDQLSAFSQEMALRVVKPSQ